MLPEEKAEKAVPLERREIRGLTWESLLKYGAIIVSFIVGFYMQKAKSDALEIRVEKLEKRQDAQDIKQNTDEVWKARTEEQLKK